MCGYSLRARRRELRVVQLAVKSFLFEQLFVSAAFHNIALVHNEYEIGVLYGGQSMRNDEARASARQFVHGFLYEQFRSRIDRMIKLEKMEENGEFDLLPKKEVAKLKEEMGKLQANLNGIRDMGKLPGVMFIVDPHNEDIAVKEARKLNIPIVAITDTNCDPDLIDCVIPGNDDAIRAVKLISSVIANAVIEANQGETPVLPVEEEGEPTSIEEVVAAVEEPAEVKEEE